VNGFAVNLNGSGVIYFFISVNRVWFTINSSKYHLLDLADVSFL
jgi:hypothetical protein